MTHILRKEEDRYFIYFGEKPYPETLEFKIDPDTIVDYNGVDKYNWLDSCAKKGNKVEVAKEDVTKFFKVADRACKDARDHIEAGIEIPLCYEVRGCQDEDCTSITDCGHGEFAYFKEPEPVTMQVVKDAARIVSKDIHVNQKFEKFREPECKQEREEPDLDFLLNRFGNYLLNKNIKLKHSNHVCEVVTDFMQNELCKK